MVGEILDLASRYAEEGADELVFYDITASPESRQVDRGWIRDIARIIDIPFCVAGGIKSLADAEEVLNQGADKISINSPALANPELINTLAKRFGSQCIVVGIDSREEDGRYCVYQYTGDPEKSRPARSDTLQWVEEVESRGAGEIVLNCMNQDGVRQGYDCKQLSAVRTRCSLPLIASGGAGKIEHFKEVFEKSNVNGALAASVFHQGDIHIATLKNELIRSGLALRPA